MQFDAWPDHPGGRDVHHVQPTAIRPTNAPIVTPKPFEQFGASTRRILSELGYTEQEIATMITDRVVSERWTDEYLPN
ncbi:MAG: hypothetical protein R2743_24485 [Ilumatobacteraceae bacterium]